MIPRDDTIYTASTILYLLFKFLFSIQTVKNVTPKIPVSINVDLPSIIAEIVHIVTTKSST